MGKIDFNQYIIEIDELVSTNLYLKENFQKLPNYTIVKTNYQTRGVGQFGRVWESNYGENLLFSILIKKDLPFLVKDINPVFVSSLISLLSEFGVDAKFEYPNDVFVGNKKIAGFLIETKYSGPVVDYIIVGIGVNINQEEFTTTEATSLKNVLGKEFNINDVFKKYLKHLSNSILLANLMYLVRMNENEWNKNEKQIKLFIFLFQIIVKWLYLWYNLIYWEMEK